MRIQPCLERRARRPLLIRLSLLLGELLVPTPNGFDPARHIARNAPLSLQTAANNARYYTLHIPWSKTTHLNGLTITLTDREDPTSPVAALTRNLVHNRRVPSTAPFFAYESAAPTGWSPMTRTWFLQRCNDIWRNAGLTSLTGHSFRIGGTTELLLRGVPPQVVAMQGRWESGAFLKYWRNVEAILPLYVSGEDELRRHRTIANMVEYKKSLGRL